VVKDVLLQDFDFNFFLQPLFYHFLEFCFGCFEFLFSFFFLLLLLAYKVLLPLSIH